MKAQQHMAAASLALGLAFSGAAVANAQNSEISPEQRQQNTQDFVSCIESNVNGDIDYVLPRLNENDLVDPSMVFQFTFIKTMVDCTYEVAGIDAPQIMDPFNVRNLFSFELLGAFEEAIEIGDSIMDVEAFEETVGTRVVPAAEHYFEQSLENLQMQAPN